MKIENWNGHNIRFVEKAPGEWWAVAKDVADALGYNHTPHMVEMIDAAECDVGIADTTSGKAKSRKMQDKSREEMKLRLLQDIRTDMAVCEVEGWNPAEYIDELIELLEGLKHANNRAEN